MFHVFAYCWCLFELLLFHLDVVKVHFLATFLSSFVPIFLFFILSLHLIFPFSIPKYFSFKIDYMDAKKNPYYMCQESQWWKMWMLIHHKCFYFMFCVCFNDPPPCKNPRLKKKSSYFYMFLGSHKNSFMYMKVSIFVGSNEVKKYLLAFGLKWPFFKKTRKMQKLHLQHKVRATLLVGHLKLEFF